MLRPFRRKSRTPPPDACPRESRSFKSQRRAKRFALRSSLFHFRHRPKASPRLPTAVERQIDFSGFRASGSRLSRLFASPCDPSRGRPQAPFQPTRRSAFWKAIALPARSSIIAKEGFKKKERQFPASPLSFQAFPALSGQGIQCSRTNALRARPLISLAESAIGHAFARACSAVEATALNPRFRIRIPPDERRDLAKTGGVSNDAARLLFSLSPHGPLQAFLRPQ